MALAQPDLTNPAALPLTSPDGVHISDLETAEQYLENVRLEIKDIESQLGERNRSHPDGARMTSDEYWAWRSKAVRALYHKQRWATRLQQFVRGQRGQRQDARTILQRAYPVLRGVVDGILIDRELALSVTEEARELLGKSEGF